LVAAAPLEIPEPLLQQLALWGRLVIPVGPRGKQHLLRITRTPAGYEEELLEYVSFVPLLGGAG
jgi:protein-L-isoaspartate(D-aspartate) O-methyltransferase